MQIVEHDIDEFLDQYFDVEKDGAFISANRGHIVKKIAERLG